MLSDVNMIIWNMRAIENGKTALVGSAILCIIPGWKSLRQRRYLILIPFIALLLFSMPVILAAVKISMLDEQFAKAFSTPVPGKHFSITDWIDPPAERDFEQVVFSETPDESLRLNLFRSAKDSRLSPLVILIHGGGFYSGNRNWMNALCGSIASKGLVTASIDYRLAPATVFPGQVMDTYTSLRFLKTHALEFGIDTNRIYIAGSSAGGTIALSSAALSKTKISGVINLYGITDLHLNNPGCSEGIADLAAMRDGYLGENYSGTFSSPMEQNYHGIPVLTIHGAKDNIVPVEHARIFHEKLTEAGNKHLLIELPWATHNFEYPVTGPSGQLVTAAIISFVQATASN
jgi:acetyl esterase/lipase